MRAAGLSLEDVLWWLPDRICTAQNHERLMDESKAYSFYAGKRRGGETGYQIGTIIVATFIMHTVVTIDTALPQIPPSRDPCGSFEIAGANVVHCLRGNG